MSAPILRCFATAGRRHGLGHWMRTLAIATEAHARGWEVVIHLRGDHDVRRLVREELTDAGLTVWRGPEDCAAPADWVMFDTREPIAADLSRAREAGARSLVLDRIDAVDAADLTVLPNLHSQQLDHPRLVQGAEFCVIGERLRALAADDPAPLRDRILVTFGGADPRGLTGASAEPLAEALRCRFGADAPPVHCVLGRCFRADPALLQRLAALGWRVHAELDRTAMGLLMRRAGFAIAGFGTTVYELACFGVPALYVTHHASDGPDARRLEQRGLGALAAEGSRFDADAFRTRLDQTALDSTWCEHASERARTLVGDGDGATRIVDRLDQAA